MSVFQITLTETDAANVQKDAANARAEARLGEATLALWDATYAASVKYDVKRADAVNAVMAAAGIWRDEPQKVDGVRTPYGNVWQRMAARYDAAKKRASADEPKPVVLRVSLSGEGGGSSVVPADHPLYDTLVNLIAGADVLA